MEFWNGYVQINKVCSASILTASVAKKDLDRINLTIQSYNDNKNHQNVIQYLKKISCHYRGKKYKFN